jgi:mRNA-degrading endonuclease RelE of RelBE toxin-antitoxin system
MKIELTKTAFRQLSRLPKSEAKKIARKLYQLQDDPYSAKKLAGKLKDRYVVRAWPYRIIYVIARNMIIQIEIIEHRQGVYK